MAYSSFGVGDGDEEVSSGLARCGFVAEVNEVLSRLMGGSEVNHSAFVDQTYLPVNVNKSRSIDERDHTHCIEQFIQLFSCLIEGRDGGKTSSVSRAAQSFDEF